MEIAGASLRNAAGAAAVPLARTAARSAWVSAAGCASNSAASRVANSSYTSTALARSPRSEEHTSELQSLAYLVCRLLLEKKKDTATPLELSPRTSSLIQEST